MQCIASSEFFLKTLGIIVNFALERLIIACRLMSKQTDVVFSDVEWCQVQYAWTGFGQVSEAFWTASEQARDVKRRWPVDKYCKKWGMYVSGCESLDKMRPAEFVTLLHQ